jgi:hypothetical protein
VLLAGTARAGVVAADFGGCTDERRLGVGVPMTVPVMMVAMIVAVVVLMIVAAAAGILDGGFQGLAGDGHRCGRDGRG